MVSLPFRRGVAQLLRASMPQSDARSYSYDPAISTQTWLFVLAVIRCYSAAVQPKSEDFRGAPLLHRCFFGAYQRKQRRPRLGLR